MSNQPTKLDKDSIFILVFLMVVLLIAYFLFFYEPRKDTAKLEQTKQVQEAKNAQSAADLLKIENSQCESLGQIQDQKETKQCDALYGESNCNITYSEYSYNTNTNTCIYYGSYDYPDSATGDRIFQKYLEDLKTKETLTSVTYAEKDESTDKKDQINSFWDEYSKFFSDVTTVRNK
jgi:hypothetical protein